MNPDSKTAIVLFAHGSASVPAANQAVEQTARALGERGGYRHARAAFLEPVRPDLGDAVASLAAEGVKRILVVPYFLIAGVHLLRDLPRIVERLVSIHDVEVLVAPPLDGHPAMLGILLDRAREAAEARPAGSSNRE